MYINVNKRNEMYYYVNKELKYILNVNKRNEKIP